MKSKQCLGLLSVLLMSLLAVSLGCNESGTDAGAGDASEVADTSSVGATPEKDVNEVLDIDPDNFDDPTNIDNEWFPMKPGMRFVWEGSSVDDEGESEDHQVVFTVTDLTKVIDGVRTVVCWDQDIVDGEELVESEIVFFAQDNDGAIWSLGEYPEEYEDDEFVAAPCWIHGVKDAKAGILIPANSDVGTPSFSQGWSPSVGFTDRGKIDQKGQQKMTVPFGTFEDILVIDEWNDEEPDAHALKYYARGIGHIAIRSRGEGDQETLDLVEKRQLSPTELKQARDAALQLEANAYERSKDVYALTKPSDSSGADKVATTPTPPKETSQETTPDRRITEEQAKEIALKKVPGDITGVAIERKLGKQAIVVEVLAEDGSEIDVIIDPQTGEVLGTED